jgi:hypothetical protein
MFGIFCIGSAGFFFYGYLIGRAHGYKKFEEIGKEEW